MFTTCIFCNKDLGKNEAIEQFPVGKRLAFDQARGRLWVVCPSCERWNLSPLEARWEAIEAAERLYRDTRKRVATDNIGLAKVADGTTLVRVGEPLRPEFAAWRYGDQFGRRRNRAMLLAGGGVAALAGLYTAGAVAGAGVGAFGYLFSQLGSNLVNGSPNTVVAKIRDDSGAVRHVRRRHLGESELGRADDGSMALRLRFKNGERWYQGDEAHRIAGLVIPSVNRFGGNKKAVERAVTQIEAAGSPETFLSILSETAPAYIKRVVVPGDSKWKTRSRRGQFTKHGLFSLPAEQRLALEMALHEESERRAMEGELAELERVWREAEEVAHIADNLLVPESVDEQFRKLKGGD
jgi:hypothetical protein